MDLKSEKREIRRILMEKRDRLTEKERRTAADAIFEKVTAHPYFETAEAILSYAATKSEISTDKIMEYSLERGKTIFLPKVTGEDMSFFRIGELGDLEIGYRGIREPAGDGERFESACFEVEKVLFLVPGVGFDRLHHRIGYGKGFYDRYLSAHPRLIPRTVGLAYACQMADRLPCEEHDIRLQTVLTV